MSAEIDYDSLKYAKPNDKSLVFGYITNNFNQTRMKSSENIINYTILAFYHDNCDTFDTSILGNYDVSSDGKCLSGLGYGTYAIDPNDKRYNRYQWMIKINETGAAGAEGYKSIFGITTKVDMNVPWCCNVWNIVQYNFSNDGVIFYGLSKPGFRRVPIRNKTFKRGDVIVLDLDTRTHRFSLYVNGKCGSVYTTVNCNKGIKYRLACLLTAGISYITIEGFSKFNDQKRINKMDNLINYNGKFSVRCHPSGPTDIDYSRMIRAWDRCPECIQFRAFDWFKQKKWKLVCIRCIHLKLHLK